jgi:hypothetical protein
MDSDLPAAESIDARAEQVAAALDEAAETEAESGDAPAAAAAAAPSAVPPAGETPPAPARSERDERARRLDALLDELRHRDPVLQEGARTDWERLARENPPAFAERFPAFQSRLAAFDAARRERERIAEEQAAEALIEREHALLVRAAPELREPARLDALRRDAARFLEEAGFTGREIRQIGDHRALLIVRDAMRWRRQEQARDAIAAKRVEASPPKTLRPAAAEPAGDPGPRLAALKRRAGATGKLDDRAAYVLAALDDGD